MRALSVSAAIQIPHQLSSPLRKQAFPITTTRNEREFFPQQLSSLRVVNSAFKVVAAAEAAKLSRAEKEEEVKSLLTLLLKELSLKDTMEFCKSDNFIDHLVSKLHTFHRIGFPVERELTHVEIRDALIPSIESLVEENLDILVHKEKLPIPHQTINNSSIDSIKPTDMVPVGNKIVQQPTRQLPPQQLPPQVIDNGMDLNLIKEIVGPLMASGNYNWNENTKPLIEFILQLGVPQSNIPMIIQRCPKLLKTSRQVIMKSTIDYFYELGLSKEDICKIVNIYPNILGRGVAKLRSIVEYFRSKGIDPTILLLRRPIIFDRRLEVDLKPVIEFFFDRGFSADDIVTMSSKHPKIYSYSVRKILPKWEYFLTLDYPRSAVVMFPQYFGYKFEERIKPRCARLKEIGLKLSLAASLTRSNDKFEKLLNNKRRVSLSV